MRTQRSFLAVVLVVGATALAQTVPTSVSFTGRLVDNGTPVQGPRDFVFKLFPTAVEGTETWSETRNAVNVVDGTVNLELGASTPLTDAIFDGQTLYLEVTVGGAVLTPRTPVMSVPYALRSTVTGRIGALTEPDIQKRVGTSCAPGSAIRSIAADGTVTCQASSVTVNDGGVVGITGVYGGAGLSGGAATGDVNLVVNFAGSGTATTASRSDHNHAGTYLPLGPVLACLGTDKVVGINSVGSVVCAPDIDTTNAYSPLAGGGLALSGNQFSLGPCPAGLVLKSTGAGWSCQADSNSGGTVTSITAGTGLTGGPITGTGALDVNFGAVAGTVTQGNDPRLLPPAAGAGRMLYDNGSVWLPVAAGTASNVLVGGATPSWSSATGITSLGTLSSVNVTGTATVGSLAFAAPKTSYVTVHASAFHPVRSTEGYSIGGNGVLSCCGSDRSYVAAAGVFTGLAAPVSFPQGATPTTLTCRVFDNSSVFSLSVKLVDAFAGGSVACSASTGPPGNVSPAYQTLTGACAALPPVDNTSSAWWLGFQTDGACGAVCAIVSCTVTYTMTGLP